MSDITLMLSIVLPSVVGIIVFLVSYFVYKKSLKEAVEDKEYAEKITEEVLAFYDPEKSTSSCSDMETIFKIEEHPMSYKMEQDAIELVTSTCKDNLEKSTVLEYIREKESEMEVDYLVYTSGATYRIYYGVPQIQEAEYEGLSQSTMGEICDLSKEDTFLIMYTIAENQRKHNKSYDIKLAKGIIHIDGSTYSVSKE